MVFYLVIAGYVVWIVAQCVTLAHLNRQKPIAIYNKYPRSVRQRLTIPFYRRWATLIDPGDVPSIAAWRRSLFRFVGLFWLQLIVMYAALTFWVHTVAHEQRRIIGQKLSPSASDDHDPGA